VLSQPAPPDPRIAAAAPIEELDPAAALMLGIGIVLIVASALPRVVTVGEHHPRWLDRCQLGVGLAGAGCALAALASLALG
jgi:hypothetical protein